MARRNSTKKLDKSKCSQTKKPPAQFSLTDIEVARYKTIVLELENIQLRIAQFATRRRQVLLEREKLAQELVQRVSEIDDPGFYDIDLGRGIAVRKNPDQIETIERSRIAGV